MPVENCKHEFCDEFECPHYNGPPEDCKHNLTASPQQPACVPVVLNDLLSAEGLKVVQGKDAVLEAIFDASDGQPSQKLCSGFGVFPDGEKCSWCSDCKSR